MKIFHYLVWAFAIIPSTFLAQANHDYNMVLGYQSNSNTPETELYNFNFNNPPDNPFDLFDGFFDIWFSTTTMSDAQGNLIFYTNGCQIANADHELMENGDSLNVGPYWFERDCNAYHTNQSTLSAYNAGTQSIMSLPVPFSDNEYYLIHLLKELTPDPIDLGFAWIPKMLLTRIDMNANNGLGTVLFKNEPILEDTLSYGLITAVKHADNNRWWILCSQFHSNKYYSLLLGADGVETIVEQSIGPLIPEGNESAGMRVFSPDGNKIALNNFETELVLYNFDRETGTLSNAVEVQLNDLDQYIGGVCFSSNNRYLYASTTDTLYQLDMEAPDIAASKTVVAVYDGYTDPFTLNFYQMERGPDCKIYINSTAGAQNLHVIMSPDSPGLACDVRQHYLQLPFPRERNLLNAPNYRLGTPYPTCDSTINVVSSSTEPVAPLPITDGGVRVFPNPARERATVAFDLPFHGTLTLHDAHGRELLRQTAGGLTEYDLNLGALPGGVYFVRATTREGFVRTVRLVRMWE